MIITTKYELNQPVWGISSSSFYRIVKCDACNNTGKILINKEEYVCPKCKGKATRPNYEGHKWYISDSGNVGKIQAERMLALGNSGRDDSDAERNKISYMISSTGYPSGTVWDECNLFPSHAFAQAACDERNGNINQVNEAEPLPALM